MLEAGGNSVKETQNFSSHVACHQLRLQKGFAALPMVIGVIVQ